MLHEGLGSVGLWGRFPETLATATGLGIFVYSRAGYGRSTPVPLPRPLDYMQIEAQKVVGRLLDAIGFRRGVLFGHSDGGSIAAAYAGRVHDPRLAGISLMAPHFFLEDCSTQSIAKSKIAYETGDLRVKLGRWHENVDVAYYGWADAWLDPGFESWSIEECLPRIAAPAQIIQGEDDIYGTIRQVEVFQEQCGSPVEAVLLPKTGHSPHREAPEATCAAVAAFCQRVLADEAKRDVA